MTFRWSASILFACCAALAAAPAGAMRTSASLTLGGFAVDLVDLDPEDDVAPAIAFGPRATGPLFGSVRASLTVGPRFFASSRYDLPFLTSASAAMRQPTAWSRATLGGGPSFADLTLAASAVANNGTVAGNPESSALGLLSAAGGFVLSAHTRATFRSLMTASLSARRAADPRDSAIVSASVMVYGLGGEGGEARLQRAFGADGRRRPGSASYERPLEISFVNPTSASLAGSVLVQALAGASAYTTAVPEPATAALVAAGLTALAVTRRRRPGRPGPEALPPSAGTAGGRTH